MSLWTPDGEHPVDGRPAPATAVRQPPRPRPSAGDGDDPRAAGRGGGDGRRDGRGPAPAGVGPGQRRRGQPRSWASTSWRPSTSRSSRRPSARPSSPSTPWAPWSRPRGPPRRARADPARRPRPDAHGVRPAEVAGRTADGDVTPRSSTARGPAAPEDRFDPPPAVPGGSGRARTCARAQGAGRQPSRAGRRRRDGRCDRAHELSPRRPAPVARAAHRRTQRGRHGRPSTPTSRRRHWSEGSATSTSPSAASARRRCGSPCRTPCTPTSRDGLSPPPST